MKQIPFTQLVVLTGDEVAETVEYVIAAENALESAAAANLSLLTDLIAERAKASEYAKLLVSQSDTASQLMQINLLVSDALGKVRQRIQEDIGGDAIADEVEEIAVALEAQLQEFATA